jgi:hypothetical protein
MITLISMRWHPLRASACLRSLRQCATLGTLWACTSCGTGGEGTVSIRAYGESFIEDGIGADDVDDGWALAFDKFIVHIKDVTLAGSEIDVDATVDVSRRSSGQGHEIGSALVPTGSHTRSSFTTTGLEIEGTAWKGDETKSFKWRIEDVTRYVDCETTTKVTAGAEAALEITIHADHLLYDSLVSDQPRVLFQAYADADQDQDGTITEVELAATDIGNYDPGSDDGVDDLRAWLVAQSRTLGHVDGEAHCTAKSVK